MTTKLIQNNNTYFLLTFLSLNIQLKCPEGKNFDLELDCKRETYYVVNNRLNALFFSKSRCSP